MSNFGIKNIWKDTNTGTQVDTSNFVTLDGTQTITGAKTLGTDLNLNNHKITNLTTPTTNNDAANKSYVDTNKYGDNFVKIYTVNSGVITNTSDVNWAQVVDFTTMQNSFSITNGSVYEVLFKSNISSADIYTSTLIAVNVATYENRGFSDTLFWDMSNNPDGIKFAISLKGSQFKLWSKRGKSGVSGNWNTATYIYVRKVGGINS